MLIFLFRCVTLLAASISCARSPSECGSTFVSVDTEKKRCSKCHSTHPVEQFSRSSRNKDGRQGWCKACTKEGRNRWYQDNAANREKNLAYQRQWREANPDKKRASTRAWELANPERSKANKRAYQEANKERLREYNRQWVDENRDSVNASNAVRRAHKAGLERQPWTRLEIFDRDGGRCRICDKELDRDGHRSFAIDHIVPIKLDGPDIPANLQLLCPPCNGRKRDRLEGQIHFGC